METDRKMIENEIIDLLELLTEEELIELDCVVNRMIVDDPDQ